MNNNEKVLLDNNHATKVKREIDDNCIGNLIRRSHPRNDPLGCYSLKEKAADTLNGLTSLNSPNLTFSDPYRDSDKNLMDPGLCVNHCGNYLFKYAALGNGTDCRCGKDDALLSYTSTDVLDCNLTCVGNATDKCGGEKAYTIYDTTELPDDKKPKITIEQKLNLIQHLTNNSYYRGCVKDNPYCNQRVLNGSTSEKFPSMTVDYCIDFCYKNNFKYAGLEIGNECFCDNDYRKLFLEVEECSSSCVGNSQQICGGPLALSVYEVNQNSLTSSTTNSLTSSTTNILTTTTSSVPNIINNNSVLVPGLPIGIVSPAVIFMIVSSICRFRSGRWFEGC